MRVFAVVSTFLSSHLLFSSLLIYLFSSPLFSSRLLFSLLFFCFSSLLSSHFYLLSSLPHTDQQQFRTSTYLPSQKSKQEDCYRSAHSLREQRQRHREMRPRIQRLGTGDSDFPKS